MTTQTIQQLLTVSTHSRAEAAAANIAININERVFQHTAARRRLL